MRPAKDADVARRIRKAHTSRRNATKFVGMAYAFCFVGFGMEDEDKRSASRGKENFRYRNIPKLG